MFGEEWRHRRAAMKALWPTYKIYEKMVECGLSKKELTDRLGWSINILDRRGKAYTANGRTQYYCSVFTKKQCADLAYVFETTIQYWEDLHEIYKKAAIRCENLIH